MRTIIFIALFIGISSVVCADTSLKHWFKSSDENYDVKIDEENSSTGTRSAVLYSLTENNFGYGRLYQTLKPCPESKGNLGVSVYLQTENATRAGLSVGVWSSDGITVYGHDEDETWGTTSWTLFEKNIVVPNNCQAVSIGVYLEGIGKVWMDDFNIEEIDEVEPLSKVSKKIVYEKPDKIISPGFEE